MAIIESSATIQDGLDQFAAKGYNGQFRTTAKGRLECIACDHELDPAHVRMDLVCRVEGTSDPADQVLVAALTCPAGHKGTEVFTYGPGADPMESEALRALEDGRRRAN